MTTTPHDSGIVPLGEFTFECGRSIPELRIAYETYGEFTGENAVLVCHALTGSQNVARTPEIPDTDASGGAGTGDAVGSDAAADEGVDADAEIDAGADGDPPNQAGQARAWWDDVVGPGKAIDTTEYYVVCANVPGSCYGSSGPASRRPDDVDPDREVDHDRWALDFPPVQVGDWTRAQRRLLDHLGVGRLHAVVGGSVGGMNVLDWGKRYPDDADHLVAIATAARLDPQCLALDAIARRAIRSDPDWNGGDYYGDRPGPDTGLGLARQIGHVMYLSKSSMDRKFGRRSAGRDSLTRGEGLDVPENPTAAFFPYREVESYLDYNAGSFADRFDANSYLYLTRAMDEYDLAGGYASDADALAAFTGEALVMSFTDDWHFTVDQSVALADAFGDADVPVAHHIVDSDHGHDAFLVEPESVGPPVRDFLRSGIDGKSIVDAAESDEPVTDGSGTSHAPVHSSLFSG
ncbi:homoserine O-acetyltransferase [Halopenitus malekzadehii]|uniref:Homoserine O-acetyltransferase n=1 Tax=Halopenitus malekzadehii TaxID=1267564 RepID=A0A1H6IVN8_9EURY|nr:homoserine O-acetyltransferase [Halopenitus malekzadehii]SEH50530.1 homoserine O-acetyltransferase [Halopenitus malekzadehii]